MGRRGAVWLAWGVTAAAAAIVALTWLLFIMNQAGPVIREPGTEDAWALASGTLLIFCLPGAVIISRRPANLVGWILVAIGMSYGLSGFVTEYGTYALVTAPGALPAGTFAFRYDVARTVEAFSARLRDQIDLDTLSAELLAVTDQTMQPHQAWLWLRPSTDRVRHTGV